MLDHDTIRKNEDDAISRVPAELNTFFDPLSVTCETNFQLNLHVNIEWSWLLRNSLDMLKIEFMVLTEVSREGLELLNIYLLCLKNGIK